MASHKPNLKRVTEHVRQPFVSARVNREAGTIADVLICGTSSVNGRDYPLPVLRRDCARYEGRPVNCDHSRESTVDRRLGWFTDVKPGADGRPRGTLHLLKSHPMYERVMEAAERNPSLYGFSHVAMCKTRAATKGRETVESIDEVISVDLVAEPATTKSLFEGAAVKTTLVKLIESVLGKLKPERAKPTRKWLVAVEDDAGMAPMLDSEVDEPAEGTDPDQAIDDAFKQAMHAQVDALLDESHTLADFISKCRELYKSRAKIMGKAAPKEGEGDGAGNEPAAEEGKTVTLASVRAECKAGGLLEPSADDLEALMEITSAAGRGRLIAGLKRAAEGTPERPSSSGRSRIAPTPTPTPKTEGKPPADGKEFAAWVA